MLSRQFFFYFKLEKDEENMKPIPLNFSLVICWSKLACLTAVNSLFQTCGLYYKPMTIANDDYSVVNKLGASLTDDARVVIYDCNMFIVQTTDVTG